MNASEGLEPKRVAELVRDGAAQLVDVRQQYEYAAGRIAGATHIELDRLPEEFASVARGRAVVFYCRSGSRSALAADAFRASGYDAYNLVGGLEAWVACGLALEPANGRVA